MDENLTVLLILGGVAGFVGVVTALASSRTIRTHGMIGVLRRQFSGGRHRSPYGS